LAASSVAISATRSRPLAASAAARRAGLYRGRRPLRQAFVDLVKENYQAGLDRLDFRGAAETARLAINQWVDQQTAGKIKDLIQPGAVGPGTRLVLTNAGYFQSDWLTAFEKRITRDEDFRSLRGAPSGRR
jgi:serpin B